MNKAKLTALWRRQAWRRTEAGFGLGAGSVAAILAVSILISGCSSSSDEPPPASATATGTSGTSSTTGNESFPNLGSVPDQPPPATPAAERQAIVDGLIADRKNASYSDVPLSGQPSSSVPPPAPEPITPEGGGTTLGTTTITPPANTDTGAATGTNASPPMPATPQTPVTSQPLAEPPPPPQSEPTTVPSPTGAPQPQSNATPLAPGDVQYADLSGGEGGTETDADGIASGAAPLPGLTQIADSGQPATVTANAPRGLIPQGPFGYPPQSSSGNWVKVVQRIPAMGTRTAAPSGNRSVIVDLSAIGGAPQATAPTQLPPQQAAGRPPLYVDLSVLDSMPEQAPQTQQGGYQSAGYQAAYPSSGRQWQPGVDQLAFYQMQPDSKVTLVAASAVPLPPAGQPLGLIFFANGSAHLNATSRDVLHDVARIYHAQGGAIHVIGHASWIPGGDNSFNAKLSYARAQAVTKVLAAEGVPGGALEMRGVSITQPVFYETARTGIAGNRRADIFLTP